MYAIELTIKEGNRVRVLRGSVNVDTLKRLRTLHGKGSVVMVLN